MQRGAASDLGDWRHTLLAGQYKTPAVYAEVKAVFTNTVPVDAYRGAGRPEATYVVERIVETPPHASRNCALTRNEAQSRRGSPQHALHADVRASMGALLCRPFL